MGAATTIGEAMPTDATRTPSRHFSALKTYLRRGPYYVSTAARELLGGRSGAGTSNRAPRSSLLPPWRRRVGSIVVLGVDVDERGGTGVLFG